MRHPRRWLLATILLAALGVGLLLQFPDRAACRASGRTVDPTERHCESADGFVQLREHVVFHTTHVLVVASAAAALGLLLTWGVRGRSRRRRAPFLTT